MAGATIPEGAGGGSRRFAEQFVFRPAFGTRRPPAELGREPMLTLIGPRNMDCDLPDMRRRIDATAPPLPRRLPWTLAAAVIGLLSFALWRDAFLLAESMIHELAGLY